MPLYYSNFKSFSNKISRIFWFEQLFCMAFISYTERPILALGSAWEAGTRLIWSKPFIIGPEYSPIRWTAFWNRAHQKHGHPNVWCIQSNPVLWPKVIIFGALWWPNQWFYQKRVLIWLGVDTLGYNISKDQLSRSKTVASSLKKVHFWNPIWRTPSALWDGPSPRTRLYLNQSG